MKKPDNWSMDALSEHLDAGHQNCYAFFANCHTEFEKLHIIDDTFRKLVATIEFPRLNISPLPVVPLLLLRAHASFVSASHLVMCGQLPEAYMVLRACIETSLYAHHISLHPGDEKIWLERDNNPVAMKTFRKIFGNVSAMVKELATMNNTISEAAQTIYDHTIRMGGHPNPAIVLSNYFQEGAEIGINYLTPQGEYFEACNLACGRTGMTSLLIFRQIYSTEFDVAAKAAGLGKLNGKL